ncbi:MAG: hypothetical protein DBX59_10600 [Bacillota bacterium]|nr:MAG: hypothetical protein DBX59_10600 [Bacillota bacterium]
MKNAVQGKNQTLARKENQKLVFELFKKHDLSASEVSNILKLSQSGTKKIIDDLIAKNILTETTPIKHFTSGRMPMTLTLNQRYGIIACVDFFDKEIFISDLKNNILFSASIEINDKVSDADILRCAEILQSIIAKPRFSRFQLLAISIVVLGKFDTASSQPVFSYAFSDITINLKTYFSQIFTCPVTLKNDLHFAIIAEQEYGCLSHLGREINCCYLNIGEGITASYLINGKLYCGSHGLAGEIGFNITDFENPTSTLADHADRRSLLSFLHNSEEDIPLPDEFSLREVAELYKKDEPHVTRTVDKVATYIALAVKNICDILDCETFVLNGSLLVFGDKFIDKIIQALKNFPYVKTSIVKAKLGTNATKLGAIELARNLVFDNIINK